MHLIKKITASTSFLAFADQALSSGTNFLLTLLLAQKLVIKDFGLYSSVVLLTYLLVSIVSALVIQPFQVSFASNINKKQYITFLFFALMVLVVFSMLTLKLLAFFIPKDFALNLIIGSLFCFVAGFLINDFFRKLFLGLANVKAVFLMDVAYSLVGVYLFISKNIFLDKALWVLGLSNLISSLPGLIYIFKNYQWPSHWKTFVEDHFKQGKWLLSVAVLQWSSSNFFVLVAGMYLGIEALGALRLVQSFFGIINIGLQTVENYFLPKISFIYSQNITEAKRYLIKLTFFGIIFFGVLLSMLFIFSDEIIVLAGGAKYQNYGYVIKMISVLYLFIFLSYPVRISVRILILNKIFFFGYLLSFLSSLATFHFLLKFSGLYGAITGLIINQIIMILYWQNQLNKKQFKLWK